MSSSQPTVLRKGSWTQEEDNRLRQCIEKYGEGKWHQVPQRAGLNRCRKSCRLRWLNYLRPNIKKGSFDLDEVDLIIRLHKLLGNRWSLIAGRLPGRTANDVKNYWNTHVRKMAGEEGILEAGCSYVRKSSEAPKITASTIIKPRPRTFSKNSPWLMRQNAVQTDTCGTTDDRQNLSSSTDVFVPKSMSMSDQDDMQWLENLFNAKEMSEGPYWSPNNFEDEIPGNLWSETWGGANGSGNNNTPNDDFGNFCI